MWLIKLLPLSQIRCVLSKNATSVTPPPQKSGQKIRVIEVNFCSKMHGFWENQFFFFWDFEGLAFSCTVPRNGFLLSWTVTQKPKPLAIDPPYSASKNSILKIFHIGTFEIFEIFNFASLSKKPNSAIFNPNFYVVKVCLIHFIH